MGSSLVRIKKDAMRGRYENSCSCNIHFNPRVGESWLQKSWSLKWAPLLPMHPLHSLATDDVTGYSFKATAYVQYLTVSTKTTSKPYISETIKPVRHRNKVWMSLYFKLKYNSDEISIYKCMFINNVLVDVTRICK